MAGEETQTSIAPDNIRSDINAAIEKLSVPDDSDVVVEESAEPKAERDEKGKFKAKADSEVEKEDKEEGEQEEKEVVEEAKEEKPLVELKPPQSLKGDIKAKWKDIPPEIQNEFIRLESTQAKGMAKVAEDANFGKTVMQEVQPYIAMIQAEGGTPQTAIRSLLNTAYMLRTAPPAQKQQLIYGLAAQYGVDLSTPPEKRQVDPNQQYIIDRLNQFEQTLNGQLTSTQQADESIIQSEIQQFAADPSHPYFHDVNGMMANLLQTGGAKNLEDAYEKACWATPEIRNSILAEQKKREESERKKAEKELLAKKKGAATTLKSDPTGSVESGTDESLRQTIERLYKGNSQRI